MDEFAPERDLGRPESIQEVFAGLVNRLDIDGLVALYDPQAVVIRKDGSIAVGTDAIREHLSGLLSINPALRNQHLKTIVVGDVGVQFSDWKVDGVDENGDRIAAEGRACDVIRRQPDGTWRIVVDNPHGVTPK